MPKLYHHEGRWQVPGQQDRKAARVEVPTSPEPLAAWLNGRHVATGEYPADLLAGPPTQFPTEFDAQLAEPCNTADPSNRCARCQSILTFNPEGARALAHGAMLDRIDFWLDDAPLWAINRLNEIVADKVTTATPAGERIQ